MIDANHLLLQSVMIPIISAPVILALGRRLGENVGWVASIPLIYVLVTLSASAMEVYHGKGMLVASYRWAPLIGGDFTLMMDGISAPIALTIALLSFLVCIYSVGYMRGEHGLGLYFCLYMLYAAGMVGAVLAADLLVFFIFFELMLIPSWVLIAIWGTGPKERIALKYFIFTEAGALSMLAGIAATYSMAGTFRMDELSSLLAGVDGGIIAPIASAMLLGLFVKMAVFPLHTWLPDAHAEAPTPISALLSPAMIGIGGYASIRILYTVFPGLLENWVAMTSLSALSLITMGYGGFMALAQRDLKRLLAYSSISQMGYMLFGISAISHLGVIGAVLLYVSHGLAKAILFMASGIFMKLFKTRSIEELRGLAGKMPYLSVSFVIGFLSLAGVPPLLGFWSELLIFAGSIYTALLSPMDLVRLIITLLAIIMAILTAGYGLWTIRRILYGESLEVSSKIAKEPMLMTVPMIILALLTIILGIYPSIITSILNNMMI
ncbi:MAG: NADH-quinone oxidoreductase subunit M [Nitrososphaeria archaeon]|nr:NADH-quinone oxidoreductase subunit M [Nitrososphaeria archaeon]